MGLMNHVSLVAFFHVLGWVYYRRTDQTIF